MPKSFEEVIALCIIHGGGLCWGYKSPSGLNHKHLRALVFCRYVSPGGVTGKQFLNIELSKDVRRFQFIYDLLGSGHLRRKGRGYVITPLGVKEAEGYLNHGAGRYIYPLGMCLDVLEKKHLAESRRKAA